MTVGILEEELNAGIQKRILRRDGGVFCLQMVIV
jgi:hypothetical protein